MIFDAVSEGTEVGAIDLIDEQPDDDARVVAEESDGEVEVGREPPAGAVAESGAAFERHQGQDSTLGQMTQRQILRDVDDRGIAALRRPGRRMPQNVALGQPDVVRTAHVAG
jgi:hypothetical protein